MYIIKYQKQLKKERVYYELQFQTTQVHHGREGIS